jgi:hypothetical protein
MFCKQSKNIDVEDCPDYKPEEGKRGGIKWDA